jgi:hypothetical protein
MRHSVLTRFATAAARSHVHFERGACAGTAIYTLADPRDVRCARYVGQTRDPLGRYAQHIRTARLSVPAAAGLDAETPWWVRSAKHRPLYEWIRELHRDGGRLPFMWVETWVEPDADALVAERAAVMRRLAQGAALLNVEARQLGPQLALL